MFSAQFLARYEVLRPLGAGGMGEVFLARERALDRPVAIKTVLGTAFANDEARRRFLREARITAGLSHPVIVKVLDHGEDEGRLYIIFDYVEGGDLAQLLRDRGPLVRDAFFPLAPPIVDAVAHAHAAGILHRDIKASNVLLDRDGNPRLADFGLAKGGDDGGLKTATGQIMGTPRYMAPELALARPASPATDQYALGVLLYEMVAGLPPFDAPQPVVVLKLHIDAPVPALSAYRPDAPPSLAATIQRALAKRPEERFPSVAALHEALRALESEGLPWTSRAPAGPATVNVPASDVRPLGGSGVRVRRGTGRIAAPSPDLAGTLGGAPVAAESPPAAAPATGAAPHARSTGRTRVSTGARVPSALAGSPASPPPAGRPRVLLVGAAIACIACAGLAALAGLWLRRPDPRFDALTLELVRGRQSTLVTWRPALTAPHACAMTAHAESSADTTSALRLPGQADGILSVTAKLTDPRGNVHILAVDSPAITLESLTLDLARAHDVPGVDRAPGKDASWSIEDRLTYRFSQALNALFRRLPTRPERYAFSQDLLARALAQSGCDRALAWYRDHHLEPLLEQASLLLTQPGDWRLKAAILRTAHAIANLESFLLTSGLAIPAPALRFQYGLAPGPIPGLRRRVLDGPGDFSRSAWCSQLLVSNDDVASARLALEKGSGGKLWFARSASFQLTAKPRRNAADPVGELLNSGNSDEGFPPEYHTDGIGTTWRQLVLDPVAFPTLVLPEPEREVKGASVILHVFGASALTHVDLTTGAGLLLCFRTPPGLAANSCAFAWALEPSPADAASSEPGIGSTNSPRGRPGLYHRARIDTAALPTPDDPLTLTVHCARGDGYLQDSTSWLVTWKARIDQLGLRYDY